MKTNEMSFAKTLLLVDGSSFLYRAFHAMPDLRNRHGDPTGAIYGVRNMLRKLRHDYPADYSPCAFDAKGKTFRGDAQHSLVAPGDKDLAQLVNAHVPLVNTMSNETLDVPGVNAKFGVPPERIVDYLTLTGDPVDNAPGVEKVGPKPAAKWTS